VLRSFGYDCKTEGNLFRGQEDSRLYAVLVMPADPAVGIELVEAPEPERHAS
jgi:hypothetical protein